MHLDEMASPEKDQINDEFENSMTTIGSISSISRGSSSYSSLRYCKISKSMCRQLELLQPLSPIATKKGFNGCLEIPASPSELPEVDEVQHRKHPAISQIRPGQLIEYVPSIEKSNMRSLLMRNINNIDFELFNSLYQ